jgi:hypothetical protein
MGPMRLGKSDISRDLAKALGISHINVDEFIRKEFNVDNYPVYNLSLYDPNFNPRKVINDIKSHEELQIRFLREALVRYKTAKIIDMPGTFGVFSNKDYLEEAIETLKQFKNIFLILPSESTAKNLSFLKNRARAIGEYLKNQDETLAKHFSFRVRLGNHYLISSKKYALYGAEPIYIGDKSNKVLVEEIKGKIKI